MGSAGPKGIPGNLLKRDYCNDETMYNYYSENFGGNYRCQTEAEMLEIECSAQWRAKVDYDMELDELLYKLVDHEDYLRVLEKTIDFMAELKVSKTDIDNTIIHKDKKQAYVLLDKCHEFIQALHVMLHLFVYRDSKHLTQALLEDAEYVLDSYSETVKSNTAKNYYYYRKKE